MPQGKLVKFFPNGYLRGSFGELTALFLERAVWVRYKRPDLCEQLIRHDLLPPWCDRELSSLNRQDVTRLLDQIVLRGASSLAIQVRSLARLMFEFAIERQLCDTNPVVGTRPPAKVKSRDRFLSPEEIAVLWAELHRRSHRAFAVLKAILATGQRPGEVCKMEWAEVEGDWWEIPAEKCKNGRAHRVYLAPSMTALLEGLRPQTGAEPFVFAAEKTPKPIVTLSPHTASLRTALPFTFNPHDLRRTVVTQMAKLEIPFEVREAVVNHKQAGVAGIYNRYDFAKEKRAAMLLWDQHLQDILAAQACTPPSP